jgi:hypothetical protein
MLMSWPFRINRGSEDSPKSELASGVWVKQSVVAVLEIEV